MLTGLEKQAGPLNKQLSAVFKPVITRQPRILTDTYKYDAPFRFDKGPEVTIDKSTLKNFSDKQVTPSVRYADLSVPIHERLKDLLEQLRAGRPLTAILGNNRRLPAKYYKRPETPRQQATRLFDRLKEKIENSDYNESIDLNTLLAANDMREGYSYRRRWSPQLPHFIRAQAKAPFVGVPNFTHPDITRHANALAKTAPAGDDYIKIDKEFLTNLDRSKNTNGLFAHNIEPPLAQDLRILRPGEPHIDGKTMRTFRHSRDGRESVSETINLPNSELSNLSREEIYMPYDDTVAGAFREAGMTPEPIQGTRLWGDQGTLFRGSAKENLLKEVPENLYNSADATKVTKHINSIFNSLQRAGGLTPPGNHDYVNWRWYTPSLRRAVGYMGTNTRERDRFVRVPVSLYSRLAKAAPKNPELPSVDDFSTLDKELKTIYQDNKLPSKAWSKL